MRILVSCFLADPLDVSRLVGEATRKLREAMPTCRWGCGPIVFSTSTAAILKPLRITMRKNIFLSFQETRVTTYRPRALLLLFWYEKTARKL